MANFKGKAAALLLAGAAVITQAPVGEAADACPPIPGNCPPIGANDLQICLSDASGAPTVQYPLADTVYVTGQVHFDARTKAIVIQAKNKVVISGAVFLNAGGGQMLTVNAPSIDQSICQGAGGNNRTIEGGAVDLRSVQRVGLESTSQPQLQIHNAQNVFLSPTAKFKILVTHGKKNETHLEN